MDPEKRIIEIYIDNIKVLIRRRLSSVIGENSLTQIEDAISKTLGNKKRLSDLPVFMNIKIGKTFRAYKDGDKNVIAANTYKVSCTCTNSLGEEELVEEKDAEGDTITVRYLFYLANLLHATCEKILSSAQKEGSYKANTKSKNIKTVQNKKLRSRTRKPKN